jgi:hypothetical protein
MVAISSLSASKPTLLSRRATRAQGIVVRATSQRNAPLRVSLRIVTLIEIVLTVLSAFFMSERTSLLEFLQL